MYCKLFTRILKAAFPGLSILAVLLAVIAGNSFITPGSRNTPAGYSAPDSLFIRLDELNGNFSARWIDSTFHDLARRGVFNGTLLFAEKGKIILEKAYGYEDLSKKDTLSVGSTFQLASVSKMFTAMAIMILKEDGKLDYDDQVCRYIRRFPYPAITIRQLLNHRSGLPRYEALADRYWDRQKPFTNRDLLNLYWTFKPDLYAKPGTSFDYCNVNYALLANIVEAVSGSPFDEFLRDHVFVPAGMKNTFVYRLHTGDTIPAYIPVGVPGHHSVSGAYRKVKDDYLNGVVGDKGVYSSVGDLFLFDRALYGHLLVKDETLRSAFTNCSPSGHKMRDGYGYGWRIRAGMDSTVYHFGWWKGFRTCFLRDMKNERTLIVLSNKSHGLDPQVVWSIMGTHDSVDEMLSAMNPSIPIIKEDEGE
jgi:CubicO group peptidase (beta-lactamase class C family)